MALVVSPGLWGGRDDLEYTDPVEAQVQQIEEGLALTVGSEPSPWEAAASTGCEEKENQVGAGACLQSAGGL